MKKTVSWALFLFFMTAVWLQDGGRAYAGNTGQISCGDYEIVTRKRIDDGREEEILYRINNKTGETWFLKGHDTGWVKLREQK